MLPQELEPETEEFFLRLVPDLARQWRGASEEQIAKLETLAGQPLPRFYRWFLMRMGTSVGSLQFRSLDLSAEKVLSCYAEGLVVPDPGSLMIGFETDEVMPLHLFYDFDHPARDDSRVISMDFGGGLLWSQFDTFREMLVWGQFITLRINKLGQSCRGLFARETDTLNRLDLVMASLGFSKPIAAGSNCAVYERGDAGMSISAAIDEPASPYFLFRFGAGEAGTIRRVLGVIAGELSLEIEIDEWSPPLSGR